MSIRLPGLVSNSSWWAPFHEYSTTGRKAGGGELKGRAENGLRLKYDYCYWDGTLCFSAQRGADGAASLFILFEGFSLFYMYIGIKMVKSHAAQVNYMAALL